MMGRGRVVSVGEHRWQPHVAKAGTTTDARVGGINIYESFVDEKQL